MLKMILEITIPALTFMIVVYLFTYYWAGQRIRRPAEGIYLTIRNRFIFAAGSFFSMINFGKEFRITQIVEKLKSIWTEEQVKPYDSAAAFKKEGRERQSFQNGRTYRLRMNM